MTPLASELDQLLNKNEYIHFRSFLFVGRIAKLLNILRPTNSPPSPQKKKKRKEKEKNKNKILRSPQNQQLWLLIHRNSC